MFTRGIGHNSQLAAHFILIYGNQTVGRNPEPKESRNYLTIISFNRLFL